MVSMRAMLIGNTLSRRALPAVSALAAATLIAACGSSSSGEEAKTTGKKLNMARVTKSIEDSFLEKRKIRAHVVCPTSIEQRKGNNFTCTATGFTGTGKQRKPFNVHVAVTQTNNSGYVTYVSY
jgi:hypothetical protein